MNRLLDDTDDELNRRRNDDRSDSRSDSRSEREYSRDKEITLNTGTVLGVFFALALLCAVFFGFGYTMGRKSAQPAVAESADTSTGSASGFSNFKPAPGSPAIQPVPGYLSKREADTANTKSSSNVVNSAPASTPSPSSASTPSPTRTTVAPAASEKDGAPAAQRAVAPIERATPSPAVAVLPSSTTANAAIGPIMVQIAAVSHQEDAEVLTSALKRHGYSVASRTDAGDRLIHVQIGPFNNKRDAEAMRQRLLGDGYNAILK